MGAQVGSVLKSRKVHWKNATRGAGRLCDANGDRRILPGMPYAELEWGGEVQPGKAGFHKLEGW